MTQENAERGIAELRDLRRKQEEAAVLAKQKEEAAVLAKQKAEENDDKDKAATASEEEVEAAARDSVKGGEAEPASMPSPDQPEVRKELRGLASDIAADQGIS